MINLREATVTKRVFFVLVALNIALATAVYARSNVEASQQWGWCCQEGACIQGPIWECWNKSTCRNQNDCAPN